MATKNQLSWAVQLDPSKIRDENTANFAYIRPICWVLQVKYLPLSGSGDSRILANGLVKFWVRADAEGSTPTYFYTGFDYLNTPFTNFNNQAIVPYVGGTFKVYGKNIYCNFELVSDAESANIEVTAYPQIEGATPVEANETSFILQDGAEKNIPMFATHFGMISDMVVVGANLVIQDKVLSTIVEYTSATYDAAVKPGQYILFPFNAVFIKSDGGDLYVPVKYYGVL